MSSLFQLIYSFCNNDALKSQKMIDDLRNKALALDESSQEEDSDYEEESDVESESESDDELEVERISIIRTKDGFYKLE